MESRTYSGSCHCSKIKYEVTTDLSSGIECNCSICSRTGYLLIFVPADKVKILSGLDSLKSYHFNKMHVDHQFCANCGVRPFGQGNGPNGPMFAINVRCLEGVDPKSLKVTQVDGRSA